MAAMADLEGTSYAAITNQNRPARDATPTRQERKPGGPERPAKRRDNASGREREPVGKDRRAEPSHPRRLQGEALAAAPIAGRGDSSLLARQRTRSRVRNPPSQPRQTSPARSIPSVSPPAFCAAVFRNHCSPYIALNPTTAPLRASQRVGDPPDAICKLG